MRTRSVSRLGLALAAILYCGVQWKYAANMGSHRIFSSLRKADRADFADMLNELSQAADRACSANPSSRLLFDDGDSASPYLKISGDRLGGCVMLRDTNITPFSKFEFDDCNVIAVREHGPADNSKLQIYNTLHTIPWVEAERWMSSDGRFGFALYRHACMTKKDGDASKNEYRAV